MSSYVGRTFGRFHVVERIGAGAMGEVYRARDEHLARDVAVKFLIASADESDRHRIRREAHALSKLNHPNIATIHDLGRDGETDFVVMEFIVGQSLADRLKTGPLEAGPVVNIARQVAAGLEQAHERGIIHRDLKPGNIMVTPRGQVKLVDFGIAAQPLTDPNEATATSADLGKPEGTLPYMAPEQITGAVLDARTDIWAFGAVLYELLTGRPPFTAPNSLQLVDRILNREPPAPSSLVPNVPAPIERVVLKALRKSPDARYQTVAEMASAFDVIAPDQTAPGTSGTVVRAPARRWPWVAAAVTLVAVVGLLVRFGTGRPAPAAGPQISALVADTTNRTGDPSFNGTVAELLSTSLEQSKFITVYPRSRVAYMLGLMKREVSTPIDDAVGREICQREGVGALVSSSIGRLGDSYVLQIAMTDPSGQVLGRTQAAFDKPSELPARIDAGVRELRTRVGESAASINRSFTPLADVTSPSLEAVQFYTLGRQRLYAGEADNAIVLFKKALELDPQFAMAHEYIGVAYTNLQDPVRAEENVAKAVALIDRVPEAERHKILADYNMLRRNYDEACSQLQVLVELRPLDPTSFMSLGYCKSFKFDFTGAVADTTTAFKMQATNRARVNLARLQFLAGDLPAALAGADELRKIQPTNFQVLYVSAQIELALGHLDRARATYQAMAAQGSDAEVEGRLGLSDLALATGHVGEARQMLDTAHQAAERRRNTLAAGRASIARAELAWDEGRMPDLDRLLEPLRSTTHPVLTYLLGRTYARAGRVADAAKIADRATPGEAATDKALAAMLRAELAIARRDGPGAMKQADAAWGLEPSVLAKETQARAYAAGGKPAEAARLFEAVLARSTERIDSYDAPGFHRLADVEYRLGVLLDDLGDHARARPHLERVLTLGSTADAGLPMYRDARKRLSVK
jgi:tetratricopeptide (TPR) repeat protein/predicted Ser/Thr protein kinase